LIDVSNNTSPTYSPDGEWIAFASSRDAGSVFQFEIYKIRTNGSELTRLTYTDTTSEYTPSWSPNNKRIVFESKRTGNYEIWSMNADGSEVSQLTNNPADDQSPAWSPTGEWIAFNSKRDGNSNLKIGGGGG
jgi:TolB protein